MKKKKFYSMIAVILIGTLFLMACSNGNKSSETKSDTNKEEQKETYEPANLVFFSVPGSSEEAWQATFGDALREEFPNYTFSYLQSGGDSSITNIVATGAQVDIIMDSAGSSPGTLVPLGLQFDISDLVKKHNVDLNRFEPSTIEVVKHLGGLYGLPINNGGLVLYYNKDIFDKFGVEYPRDGMTWDEAIELGKKLTRTEDGKQYVGLVPSVIHALSMSAYSLPFVDNSTDKAAINNDSYKALIEKLILEPAQDADYKNYIAKLGRNLGEGEFMKGDSIAMFVMNYGLQELEEFDHFNWDMAALPVFKEKPGIGTQPYPNLAFISQTSKYKDQAMQVLKFLTSDEFQMRLSKKGTIPILKNESIKKAFAQDAKYKDKNVVNALFTNEYAPPIIRTVYDANVFLPLRDHLVKVITGAQDLNTALRLLEEEANKAIEAMKN